MEESSTNCTWPHGPIEVDNDIVGWGVSPWVSTYLLYLDGKANGVRWAERRRLLRYLISDSPSGCLRLSIG